MDFWCHGDASAGQVGFSIFNTPGSDTATETKTSSAAQNTGGAINQIQLGQTNSVANTVAFWLDNPSVSQSSMSPVNEVGVIQPTDSDTGSGTDADLSITVSDTDAGAFTEASSVVASVPDTDSGAGTDAVDSLTATITASDYGSVSEVIMSNDFENNSSGTAISSGNSAGTGDNAWSSVSTGTGAVLAYDDAQAYTGTCSAKFSTGSTVTSNHLNWILPGRKTYNFRTYLYMTANPAAGVNLAYVGTSTPVTVARLHVNPNGTIGMDSYTTNNVITSTTAIALNQWVKIEFWATGDPRQVSLASPCTTRPTRAHRPRQRPPSPRTLLDRLLRFSSDRQTRRQYNRVLARRR